MDMVVFCTVVTIRTGLGNMTAQHPDRNAKVPRRRNLGKAGIAARILAAQQSYAMGLEGRALIRLVELRHGVDEGGVCRPFHPLDIQGPRPEGDVLPLGEDADGLCAACLLYTSPSPRDATLSRMPSSA